MSLQVRVRTKLLALSGGLAFLAIAAGWLLLSTGPAASLSDSPTFEIFSAGYPTAPRYLDEIALLQKRGTLTEANERLIRDQVASVAKDLKMPPALLYCLLFQESRFNHLSGLNEPAPAKGLGQFLNTSFHEINFQLERFSPNGLQAFLSVFGKDIRPVHVDVQKTDDIASYYSIPAGVAASAAYLNNRYHHLTRILEKRDISYQPEIVWAYSALAYNKGTRSVLSLWNVSSGKGNAQLVKAVSEIETFRRVVTRKATLEKALRPIWPARTAERYAEEVSVHMDAIGQCAFRAEKWPATRRQL